MEHREQWKTKLGFMLAAAGSAVGLGNIWRFPFLVGQNGGAAFVIIYLGFILLIGASLMIGEIAVGRKGKANSMDSYRNIAPNSIWHVTGLIGVILNFLILSFYSVISGWALYYFVKALFGQLLTNDDYTSQFNQFISEPLMPILFQILLILMVIYVVSKGIKNGIERWNNLLMPTLFVLLIILAIRSLTLSGSSAGLDFFLKPDFSKVTTEVILTALGQAFFSLSLATGMYVTYGSYLRNDTNIPSNVGGIVILDTLVALLSGIIIFPAVFHFGINPNEGPGLVFVTFPAIFTSMPFGEIFAALFFFLIFVAAFTSAISLLEVLSTFLREKMNISRNSSTWIMGIIVMIFGIPNTLSFGPLADMLLLDRTVFDWFDYLSSNVLMPIAGLLLSIFVGWVWKPEQVREEIEKDGNKFPFFTLWSFLIKYIIPVAILLILLQSTGIISFT